MKKKIEELKQTIIDNKSALYDRSLEQIIPLEITKSNHTFRVSHTLSALSDTRYFEFAKEAETLIKKFAKEEKFSVEIYSAKEKLWNDLAISRAGYKETPDWKQKTHILDKVNAVDALLHAQIVADSDDALDADTLFDDEALTEIKLRVMQSGALLDVKHFFREELKSELDEFLAIRSNAPNALASSVKQSASERLVKLYDAICDENEGYTSDVPAFHKTIAVSAFLNGQFNRVGKSS